MTAHQVVDAARTTLVAACEATCTATGKPSDTK
jgi:hypothetical protein